MTKKFFITTFFIITGLYFFVLQVLFNGFAFFCGAKQGEVERYLLLLSILLSLVFGGITYLCGGKWLLLVFLDKPRREGFKIMVKIQTNGMRQEYADALYEQYCLYSDSTDIECIREFNSDAGLLASYYAEELKDYDKAFEFLDSVKLEALTQDLSNKANVISYVGYSITRLLLTCQAKSEERVRETYPVAEMIFQKYGDMVGLDGKGYIEIARAYYELYMKQPKAGMERLDRLTSQKAGKKFEKDRLNFYSDAYLEMQEYDRAIEYLDKAKKYYKGKEGKRKYKKAYDEIIAQQQEVNKNV